MDRGHKFRDLWLALLIAVAVTALVAPKVMALEVDIEGGGSADITGTPNSHNFSSHHSFSSFSGKITCQSALFESRAWDGDIRLVFAPSYSKCEVGGFPVTINVAGCEWIVYAGHTQPSDLLEGAAVDLVCPKGVTGIEIKVFNNVAHDELRCHYVIHPFTIKYNSDLEITTASTPHDVDLTMTVTTIKLVKVSGSFFTCGTTEQSSTYEGGMTLRAYSDVSHSSQIGLRVM